MACVPAAMSAAASVRTVAVRAAMEVEVPVAEVLEAMVARAGVVHVAGPVAGVGAATHARVLALRAVPDRCNV